MKIRNITFILLSLLIIFGSTNAFYDDSDDDSIISDFVAGTITGAVTEACEKNNSCNNFMTYVTLFIICISILIHISWCCAGTWCENMNDNIRNIRYDRLAVGGAGYAVGRGLYD